MDEIDHIRAFNRFYTHKIGAPNRTFLDTGLTLSELRLLHEIDAGVGRVSARNLSRSPDLDLDEGNVSRLLARLEKTVWVDRVPEPQDARRRHLVATPLGIAFMAPTKAAMRRSVGPEHCPS